MDGLALIRNPSEWTVYTRSMAQQAGVPPAMVVWGDGPKQYPCLVASIYSQPSSRFVTCYVYPAEARKLVEAAGPRHAVDAASPPPAASVVSSEFHKSVAAHLLAIYHELESLNITNKERYEQLYVKYLAMVDQCHAARCQEANAKLSEGQKFILGRLFSGE